MANQQLDPNPPVRAAAGLWDRPHLRYLAIAYGFSWLFWIAAWIGTAALGAGDLPFNADLVWRAVFERDLSGALLGLSLVSLVGVYGPMIAGILVARSDPALPPGYLAERTRRVAVGARTYGLVVAILLLVTVPTLVISALTTSPVEDAPPAATIIAFLLVFFLTQLVTSGTEEIGWRGYLTAKLLPGRGFWDAGWAVGLVWAVWHFPVVVQMFVQQGMVHVQIVGSLAGFTMGIIAMAILQAWFYERTGSVFLAIVIHAAFNTLPLTIALLFADSPAALLGNLLLWVVVIVLKARHDRRSG